MGPTASPELQVTADLFQRIEQKGVPTPLMPAIGGLVTGLTALQYPEVLYQGFGNVNAILQNRDHFAPLLLFQILAVKILCTSVSKGSGLVGGAYAPSIFMGKLLNLWAAALGGSRYDCWKAWTSLSFSQLLNHHWLAL